MSNPYCVQVRVVHHRFLRVWADDERSAMEKVLVRKGEGYDEYTDPIISGIELVRCDPEDSNE